MFYNGTRLHEILRERLSARSLDFKRRHTGGFKLTPNDQVKFEQSKKNDASGVDID